MKCQVCHTNDASIVFTQIVNDEKVVLQICGDCAMKKGLSIDVEKPSHPKLAPAVPDSLPVQHGTESDDGITPGPVCDVCGLTFAQFKREGLFGCDHCHIAFGEYVTHLLKQIHGTSVYQGRRPDEVSEEGRKLRELGTLRKELRSCIEAEEYERAAALRDRIAELEGK